MYESDDIINYMYDNYGPGKDKVPTLLTAGTFTVLTAGIGLAGTHVELSNRDPASA